MVHQVRGTLPERYPLLRRLVIFRLNGWGERLAACPWLRGIHEIEFPCWYANADAAAVASSPHLGEVERVVVWTSGHLEKALLFARGVAWPKLRELHLVSRDGPQEEWVRAVDAAAGRPLATVYDFMKELYPFAASFGDTSGFIVGKLPDGAQLLAYAGESEATADGWLFNPDGTRREPWQLVFPAELVLVRETGPTEDSNLRWDRMGKVRSGRKAYLAERCRFVPAFIRVEEFTLEARGLYGVGRFIGDVEDRWGQSDPPDIAPEDDDWPCGNGGFAYAAVRRGEFTFDFGNQWWCDRTGQVTST